MVDKRETATGYRIVLREDKTTFGRAAQGFPRDEHLVLCGWYGHFLSTFQSM